MLHDHRPAFKHTSYDHQRPHPGAEGASTQRTPKAEADDEDEDDAPPPPLR